MTQIELAYGRGSVEFNFDEARFSVVTTDRRQCSDGLGRPDFLKWFEATDARALAARLVNGYEVNGQTAWALLTKAERFRVCLVSELPEAEVRRMQMVPVRTIEEALGQVGSGDGFIMPRGAAVLPRVEAT
ncbi:MAG TPA: hypothetical protein VLB46_12245 [Pyrinomonadaceae bacterium]|nr:hypothetical protein [Pyrinomonadaceae bacterium]